MDKSEKWLAWAIVAFSAVSALMTYQIYQAVVSNQPFPGRRNFNLR